MSEHNAYSHEKNNQCEKPPESRIRANLLEYVINKKLIDTGSSTSQERKGTGQDRGHHIAQKGISAENMFHPCCRERTSRTIRKGLAT